MLRLLLFFVQLSIVNAHLLRGFNLANIFNGNGLLGMEKQPQPRIITPLAVTADEAAEKLDGEPKSPNTYTHICEDIVRDVSINATQIPTTFGTDNGEYYCQRRYPMKTKIVEDECKRLLQLRMTVDVLLKYGMDPQAVCNIIGLDDDEVVIRNSDSYSHKREQRLACQVCTFIGKYIQEIVKKNADVPVPVIVAGADMICRLIITDGEDSSHNCEALQGKMPIIVSYYKTQRRATDPTALALPPRSLCAQVMWCKIEHHSPQLPQIAHLPQAPHQGSQSESPQSCDLCKNVVTMVEKAVEKDEETYEMISNAISIMCSYMPATSRCHILVEKLQAIVEWIKKGTLPNEICIRLNFCDTPNSSKPLTLPLMSTLLSGSSSSSGSNSGPSSTAVSTTSSSSLGPQNSNSTALGSNQMSCMLCQYIADAVQVSVLYDRAALPSIKQGINSLCTYLPPYFECMDIYKDFDRIVDMLDKNKQPVEICDTLQMCTTEEGKDIATKMFKAKGNMWQPLSVTTTTTTRTTTTVGEEKVKSKE